MPTLRGWSRLTESRDRLVDVVPRGHFRSADAGSSEESGATRAGQRRATAVILRSAGHAAEGRFARVAMILEKKWAERFLQACAKVRSARRRSLATGELVFSTTPDGWCWVVA